MNKLYERVVLLACCSLSFSLYSGQGYVKLDASKVLLKKEIPSLKDQNLVPLISELTGPVLVEPTLVATFSNYVSCMKTLRFNKESTKLIGVSKDGKINTWDIEKRQRLCEFSSSIRYSDAAFADDDSILTRIDDTTLLVWKKQKGQYLQSSRITGCLPEQNSNPFIRLEYSGNDNAVHFIDKHTGQCRMVLQAHYEEIETAQFNHDLSLLVTAGCDQKIHVWHVGKTPQEIMNQISFWSRIKRLFSGI